MVLLDKYKTLKIGPNSQNSEIITEFYFLAIFSVSHSCWFRMVERMKGKALGPDRQG